LRWGARVTMSLWQRCSGDGCEHESNGVIVDGGTAGVAMFIALQAQYCCCCCGCGVWGGVVNVSVVVAATSTVASLRGNAADLEKATINLSGELCTAGKFLTYTARLNNSQHERSHCSCQYSHQSNLHWHVSRYPAGNGSYFPLLFIGPF